MRVSANELKALMIAYNPPVVQKISIENYDLYIEENSEIYKISFVFSNRPQGLRGAVSGFPEPTLEIERNTFNIKKIYYSR